MRNKKLSTLGRVALILPLIQILALIESTPHLPTITAKVAGSHCRGMISTTQGSLGCEKSNTANVLAAAAVEFHRTTIRHEPNPPVSLGHILSEMSPSTASMQTTGLSLNGMSQLRAMAQEN